MDAFGIGEHRQLLEVGDLPKVDLLGELAPDRARQVFVGSEAAARQGPFPPLGIERALPQQHVKCGFAAGSGLLALAYLEHRGQYLVLGANIGHVFDCKSKTSNE